MEYSPVSHSRLNCQRMYVEEGTQHFPSCITQVPEVPQFLKMPSAGVTCLKKQFHAPLLVAILLWEELVGTMTVMYRNS